MSDFFDKVFAVTVPKKKRNTKFSKLCKRAEAKGFVIEKCNREYEIFSNTKDLGCVRIANNLKEVEAEVLDIEERF